MRRVTFVYLNGKEEIWKCRSASWGADSRNVVMYDAISTTGVKTERVLVPLANVVAVLEKEW